MNPLLILQARAEARALLFRCCEYDDFEEALAPLEAYALENEIMDEGVAIIRKAFEGIAEI
jgi:hypothetical protein